MGRTLEALEPLAPPGGSGRLVFGSLVALAAPCGWAGLGWLVERSAAWPLQALLLKPAFAGRALLAAAYAVEQELTIGHLAAARARLRALVSRPTSDLRPDLVAAAGIESLAENLVDSWVAPLLAYAAFGLAGAYAYRAANTADAMWGYRDARYEWLGKPAARLDDLLNWLPARLAATLLVLAGSRRQSALRVWRRDARRTASPNAGHPMAAAAGQLGVCLTKTDHYVLHAEGQLPQAHDLAAARRLVQRAMLLSAIAALALRQVRHG
jgi:adenosylcobinamide-phosphate synthase